MIKLTEYFYQLSSHRALRFMPRIIFGMLIIVWITSFPYRHLVWGSSSVLMRSAMPDSLLENFMFQLYYQPHLFPWVYYTHAVMAVLSLWNHRAAFAARFIAWITGVMLYQTAPGLHGASIFVLLNFACVLIPVHYDNERGWRQWLNAVSFLALRIQTFVVLTTAVLFMWGSLQWMAGSALYYLFHQTALVRGFVTEFAIQSKSMLQIVNLTLLVLASILPLALIWRRSRYLAALSMLIAGTISLLIFQHIGIGLAINALALPWIDGRSSYGTTSTPQ